MPAPDVPEGPAEEGRDPAGPGRRWGHTCNAVRGGRLLYVFGGYGQDNCQTNDVHVFDACGYCLVLIFLFGDFFC